MSDDHAAHAISAYGERLGSAGEVRLRRCHFDANLDESNVLVTTGHRADRKPPRAGLVRGYAERLDNVDEQVDVESATPRPEAVVHGGAADALDRRGCAPTRAVVAEAIDDLCERRLSSPHPQGAQSLGQLVQRRGT